MEATMQTLNVTIPSSDFKFFKELAKKMGWSMKKETAKKLSPYEQSLDDLKHGRVYEYNSLNDFIKEIEES